MQLNTKKKYWYRTTKSSNHMTAVRVIFLSNNMEASKFTRNFLEFLVTKL